MNRSECCVIQGVVPDPGNLNYFRDIIGIIEFLLASGGSAVYDPFGFRWWSRTQWREEVFDREAFAPEKHVIILSSDDNDGTWLHTRGMIKFGRPDLSIHGVPKNMRETAVKMIDRFIRIQAAGAIIEEGQSIVMEGMPEGYVCRHRGDFDDPDFNNVHVEIVRQSRA